MNPTRLPLALVLVATLFIIVGAIGFTNKTPELEVFWDVIHIITGVGLLRLNSFSRRVAVVLVAFSIFGLGLAGFFLLWRMEMAPADELPYAVAFLGLLGIALWAYRVLTRPDIISLFETEDYEYDDYEPIGTSPAQRYVDSYAKYAREATRPPAPTR